MKIGILALQGAFVEHARHIKKLNCECVFVRNKEQLNDINGLIIPGGESTAISKLLVKKGLMEPIREKILNGLPVWGTCAGLILLAKEVENDIVSGIGVMNIKVRRNAYGSQIDSFKQYAVIKEVSNEEIPLVFIRAPYIIDVGDDVKVLFKLDGNIVAAKENNVLVTSFHPELTDSLEFHKYFLSMIE
ncbi:glutamine amidotransferase subunit PdxT [Clostridium tepidiprofundi DSM 19306]|uniref:Pyridoxal 5'-phosphate synthase subunit PdxT n=1 Tax=Clostridium tepidiprofundi DSM 19306 TaxID=1121338 RepID=A0A151B5U6_9CLOT|nr:pyridoxal 5'-phosphate synthase glutaminase subunit PdxT [Clostridium tepidiprofundi]KYH35304.1 glutamine amidotransferase subunit PdxT [Clostridium tepidiprofundi DSM 19306]